MPVRVEVGNVPEWVDAKRLLGPEFVVSGDEDGWMRYEAAMERPQAADVEARLRGVGIGGRALEVRVVPPLIRKLVRAARTREARRRREGSVGFSRRGIRLDAEGKISLTPEKLAVALGRRANKARVIDACCGAGGNTIGFARAGCEVVAIEQNAQRLADAKHNARVYGVHERVDWRCADALRLVPELRGDLLFIDPPWGADYDRTRVSLSELELLGPLLEAAAHIPRKWLKLPPSFDPTELPGGVAEAVFGCGDGDRQRVKYLLVELA